MDHTSDDTSSHTYFLTCPFATVLGMSKNTNGEVAAFTFEYAGLWAFLTWFHHEWKKVRPGFEYKFPKIIAL